MSFPPMAWIILALGVLWLGLRLWSRKQDEKRQEARDARMAELLAEREQLLEKEAPHSLGAVVSDSAPPPSPKAEPPRPRPCAGCRTVNPADATTCAGCGLEL